MDMYSRVKRRKSMRRSTFNMPAHHKVMNKAEDEEEEEGTEGDFFFFFVHKIAARSSNLRKKFSIY